MEVKATMNIFPKNPLTQKDKERAVKLLEANENKHGYLVKWLPDRTLNVQVYGSPRLEDYVFLDEAINAFNTLRPTPFLTRSDTQGNNGGGVLKVCYTINRNDFNVFLSEHYNGYTTWWYSSMCTYHGIVDGERLPNVVMVENQKSQNARNAILLHELMHGFGFEHMLSPYHFLFSIMGGFFQVPWPHGLSGADLAAMKMLHDPAVPMKSTVADIF
jgi:hypothetical protein